MFLAPNITYTPTAGPSVESFCPVVLCHTTSQPT